MTKKNCGTVCAKGPEPRFGPNTRFLTISMQKIWASEKFYDKNDKKKKLVVHARLRKRKDRGSSPHTCPIFHQVLSKRRAFKLSALTVFHCAYRRVVVLKSSKLV